MIDPVSINTNGGVVTVSLMDDSWIINQCAGAHPFKPHPGIVWNDTDHCARLPEISGTKFQDFLREIRDNYGNCAAIAWHGDRVLGHLVWIPKSEARKVHATGWQYFGSPEEDGDSLVIINLAFCSLSGHEFRGQGIGKALVNLMIAWAQKNEWRTIEVYDASGGLFPWDWLDSCIPPKPFWEGRDFTVFAHRPHHFSDGELDAMLTDNPRNSDQEQSQKQTIIAKIRAGQIDESQMGNFDLRFML